MSAMDTLPTPLRVEDRAARVASTVLETGSEPTFGLFTRHLPPRPLSDASIHAHTRWQDYRHLALRLETMLGQYRDYLGFHALEAEAIAGLSANGHELLPYIADLGHALAEIEKLLDPQGSAVPQKGVMLARVGGK